MSLGPRVAYVSPLPPDPSGIADYSEELAPELARLCTLELFSTPPRPRSPALSSLPWNDASAREAPRRLREFDAILYHMGNSPAHERIYDLLAEVPGLVVLHEWVLHHMLAHRELRRGNIEAYLDELRRQHGAAPAEQARVALWWGGAPPWETHPLELPLNERVLRSATGFIVHSRFLADRLRRERPDVPVEVIEQHAAPPPEELLDEEAREPSPEGVLRLVTVGHLTPPKRIDRVVEAVALAGREVALRYDLVGRVQGYEDLPARIRRLGLEHEVRFHGRVPKLELYRRLLRADVAVQLRDPTMGETSASVMRALASGLPVLVSDVGWFRELPDEVAIKVPTDPDPVEKLAEALVRLAADREGRLRRARAARAYAAERDVDSRARAYADFIDRAGTFPRRAAGAALLDAYQRLHEIGIDPGGEAGRAVLDRLADLL